VGDNGGKRKKGLNDRQLRFVQCYAGNATEAARMAGYKNPKLAGTRLLSNDTIREAVSNRELKAVKREIMTREERQELWSNMAKNAKRDADRLKASELLGKSQADFTEKIMVGSLEQTVKELDDEELNRRIRQIDSASAALRLEARATEETVH